jgi:hypothetical protein
MQTLVAAMTGQPAAEDEEEEEEEVNTYRDDLMSVAVINNIPISEGDSLQMIFKKFDDDAKQRIPVKKSMSEMDKRLYADHIKSKAAQQPSVWIQPQKRSLFSIPVHFLLRTTLSACFQPFDRRQSHG